ncbi:hypothetical protein V5799_014740 [Amblyomma americanum]|uniref:Peptidase M13 N-terminal domain-containing protein n=1 Tax=Amblyomma americanum TaxID=6943 RepID=A0AAQ4E255_AMBAM
MLQQRSSSLLAHHLLPPSPPQPPPPPAPTIMQPNETSDGSSPIKVINVHSLSGKPSVETCTNSSVQSAAPPPDLPMPSPSVKPDGVVQSDNLPQAAKITPEECTGVLKTSYQTTSIALASGTTVPNHKVSPAAKPQGVHEQVTAPAYTQVPLSPSLASSQAGSKIGQSGAQAVQEEPEISPLPVLSLVSTAAPTESGVTGRSLVRAPAQEAVTSDLSKGDDLNSEAQHAQTVPTTNSRISVANHSLPSGSRTATSSDQELMTTLLKSEAPDSQTQDFSIADSEVSAKGVDESRNILIQLLQEEYAAAAKAVHSFRISKGGESLQNKVQCAGVALPAHDQMRGAAGINSGTTLAMPAEVVVESAEKVITGTYEMLGAILFTPPDTAGTHENDAGIATHQILPATRHDSAINEFTQVEQTVGKEVGGILAAALAIPSTEIATEVVRASAVKEKNLASTLPIPGSAIATQGDQAGGAAAEIFAPAHEASATEQQTLVDEKTCQDYGGMFSAAVVAPVGARETHENKLHGAAGRGSAASHNNPTAKEPAADQKKDDIVGGTLGSAPAASNTVREVLDVAHAKTTAVAVPEDQEGIVALPLNEGIPPVRRGMFPGIHALRAGAPGQEQQHNAGAPYPGAMFRRTSSRLPGLAPSAVAPTAAAPSAVVSLLRPLRMPEPLGSMTPRSAPLLAKPSHTAPVAVVGGPRIPRTPTLHVGAAVPSTAAQYAEIEWSRVVVPAQPVFVASSNAIRHHPADEEPLQAGGEGSPEKLPLKKSLFSVREAKHETITVFVDQKNADKLSNSASRVGFKRTRPCELTEPALVIASAEGLSAPNPFLSSVIKRLKGKISGMVKPPNHAPTPHEDKLRPPLEDTSKASPPDVSLNPSQESVLYIHAVEIRRAAEPGNAKGSERAIPSTQKLGSQCDNLEEKSLRVQESTVPLNSAAQEIHDYALNPMNLDGQPQPATPQLSVHSVALPVGASPSNVTGASTTSAASDLAQAISASSDREVSNCATIRDAQSGGVKRAAYSISASFGASVRRLLTAPVISSHKQSFFSTAASRFCNQPRLFQGVEDRPRNDVSASTPESPLQPAVDEKIGKDKKEERSEEHDLPEVVAPETEVPDEVPTAQARGLEIMYTRASREDLREVRTAVVLGIEDPPWALLACTLVLVGATLTTLLTLIFALTTVVLPAGTMKPEPSVVPTSGIIYCSSAFCDREADYLRSLLGASGKGACDNFYSYVCSAWSRAHPLKAFTGAGAAVSTDTIIQDKLYAELASLLRSNRANDVGMAVALYNACADRNKADVAANDVKELFRSWTIQMWPRDANSSIKEVWEFAGELFRDLGLGAIVDVAVGMTAKDHSIVIEMRQPTPVFSCNDASRLPVTTLFRNALSDLSLEFTHAPRVQIIDEVMNAFTILGSCPVNLALSGFSELKDAGPLAAEAKLLELSDNVRQFLAIAFEGLTSIGPATLILLKPANYVRHYLAAAMRELRPRALINYMGLLALVHLSPFLPERHVHLRQLFVKVLRGRTLPDVSNSSTLCLMAVEHALPACFSKLSESLFRAAEYNVRVPERLSQLEDAFARNVRHLSWMSDELALVSRYRLKRRRASQFGPAAGGKVSCVPSGVSRRTDSPVEFYRDVCRAQRRARLEPITASRSLLKDSVADVPPSSVRAVYDRLLRRVLVPAALFNISVPGNSAGFSLQLARYAVRFYLALLDALLLEDWNRGRDEAVRRKLQALLQCFEWDLRELPATLRGSVGLDPARSRAALLQQTAALQLALRAFQELWQVRRAWNADLRYRRLPSLSAEALFFVYYALDHCETSDPVYKGDQRLPVELRVNLPLRHLAQFAPLFNCSADAVMGRPGRSCAVVTPDTW